MLGGAVYAADAAAKTDFLASHETGFFLFFDRTKTAITHQRLPPKNFLVVSNMHVVAAHGEWNRHDHDEWLSSRFLCQVRQCYPNSFAWASLMAVLRGKTHVSAGNYVLACDASLHMRGELGAAVLNLRVRLPLSGVNAVNSHVG